MPQTLKTFFAPLANGSIKVPLQQCSHYLINNQVTFKIKVKNQSYNYINSSYNRQRPKRDLPNRPHSLVTGISARSLSFSLDTTNYNFCNNWLFESFFFSSVSAWDLIVIFICILEPGLIMYSFSVAVEYSHVKCWSAAISVRMVAVY